MKFKVFVLSLCIFAGVNMANAQDNRHEIRVSVSDGLTQSAVDVLGLGLADAVTGSKRTDEKASIVYGLGYRYAVGRFRVGADLGFAHTTSKLTLSGDKMPSIKERELNFMILPTAEFVYLKSRLVELYGNASAGVSLKRHTETGLTEAGKAAAAKADLNTSFAYQVNPIALRVGNETIGAFVEAGLGQKGFITAGLSFRF
ncbi:hypothetical protein [Xylanibacter rarus]|uniref:hypothetical protein n=1 Tax=Xylanibacter rarus TaxID=1676614 RepID=UPI003AB973A9